MTSRLHTIGAMVSLSALCFAGVAHADGYWMNGQGEPVRGGDGSCVKTGYWAAQPLVLGCDPIPAPKPKPKPARVVLLSDPNGKTGAVLVRNPAGEQLLNEPYAGLQAVPGETMQRSTESAASVRARYGDVLEATAPRPMTFVVRFETGSATKLTSESAVVTSELNKTLAKWPAPQLMVVGHTDRAGTDQANDALSLKRAQTVAQYLVALGGITADRIEVAGRGEREPLVPTEDGVAEAANRRVEITLR